MRACLALLAVVASLHGGAARAEDLREASVRLADSLASAFMAGGDRPAGTKVAVLPFTEVGVAAGQGSRTADLVGQRFGQAARVTIVDRAALQAMVGEQRLQAMVGQGRIDDPDVLARAGVKAVLSGQVSADGERLRIQVRLVGVPGQKVLATAQGTADSRNAAASPPVTGVVASSGSVEIAIRRLADGLATGFARLPGSVRYRRLAVLVFSEVGPGAQKRKLGTIVAAEVATVLRRDHGLLLVEREKLGQVLGELKLQQMASPDADQASRIGQVADAQALVLGSVADAGDRYLVTARIVATQTGDTLAAESVSIPEAAMVAVASDAVVLRSKGDAAFRSLLVPGLGQFYNREPVKGWTFAGLTLGLAAGAVGFHLAGNSAFDSYNSATTTEEALKYYSKGNDLYQTRNWLLASMAVVWVVNVVDAYVSGVDGQALLGGGVALAPAAMPGGGGALLAVRF